MDKLIHKTRFFIVSIIGVLLLSFFVWSMSHNWMPFSSSSQMMMGGLGQPGINRDQMMRGREGFERGNTTMSGGNNDMFSGESMSGFHNNNQMINIQTGNI